MITFKQFLQESQNYPLFHGMPLSAFVTMIEDNELKSGAIRDALTSNLADKPTISFTRSRNFADYWSKRKNWIHDWSYDADRKATYPIITIQVNREKLRNRYKIVPYNHFGNTLASDSPVARRSHNQRWFSKRGAYEHQALDHNQYEERLIGDIKGIIKYIDKIYFSRDALKQIKDSYPDVYDIVKANGWI